jgi:hypothetical protein
VAVLAKDDFNRPDATNLGAAWIVAPSYGEWDIAGNAARPDNFAGECMSDYQLSAVTFPDDQYSQVVIVSMTGTADTSGVGVEVRSSTFPDSRYRGYANKAASNNTCLAKHVSGTFTLLAQGTAAWADGDEIRLEVEGTTLRLIRNGEGSPVIELSDSSIASGQPGLTYSTTLTAATVENWEGGDPKTNPQVF